jgi:hypothetical protein
MIDINSLQCREGGYLLLLLVAGSCAFHDLSMGEAGGRELSGECGGGTSALGIRRREDQAGSLGTEEKIS